MADEDVELVIPPEQDLNSIYFENADFFRHHPRLTDANALLYFSQSPFYESTSLNSLMKTQLISEPQAVQDFLARSKGYYYEVDPSITDAQQPMQPVWIVRKKYSFGMEGDGEMKEIGLYYIIDNKIFQAPQWRSIAGCRMWQTTEAIRSALDTMWTHKEAPQEPRKEIISSERRDEAAYLQMDSALATLEQQLPALKKKREESLRNMYTPAPVVTPNPPPQSTTV